MDLYGHKIIMSNILSHYVYFKNRVLMKGRLKKYNKNTGYNDYPSDYG